MPGGCNEPSAAIAKAVEILRGRHDNVFGGISAEELLYPELIAGTKAGLQRGMEVQHGHHRRRERQLKLDIELGKNEHAVPIAWILAEVVREDG